MPVFNGGRYFKAALESAIGQDYGNLEIVVVNDGSNDGGETEAMNYRHVWDPSDQKKSAA